VPAAGFEFVEDVLPALAAWSLEGRAALVTLVHIEGSSPRPLGSQMAVSETGEAIGNITGGCAEAAIVAEAVAAMDAGRSRTVRFGKGSPYFDIRLPCGSAIDLLINVGLDQQIIEALIEARRARRPIRLHQDMITGRSRLDLDTDCPHAETDGRIFSLRYRPAPRMLAIGKGPILADLCRLGTALGWEMVPVSPDAGQLANLAPHAVDRLHISSPAQVLGGSLDRWTAAVLLFHEHEWEPSILRILLDTPAFYIGALGSRKTHATRLQALGYMGAPADALARVHGPVGLDIGAKSPPEIAISILAEAIQAWRRSCDGF
jgi:xanthine dehydrogenase accessory factor